MPVQGSIFQSVDTVAGLDDGKEEERERATGFLPTRTILWVPEPQILSPSSPEATSGA